MSASEARTPGWHRADAEDGGTGTAILAERKKIDNLRAAAAIAGYEVHALDDGSFVAARWGLHRECADVAALRAFLCVLGVRL